MFLLIFSDRAVTKSLCVILLAGKLSDAFDNNGDIVL